MFFKKKSPHHEQEIKSFNINNYGNMPSPSSPSVGYEEMEDIYRTNPIIFRAIQMISEAAHSMQIISDESIIRDYLQENLGYILRELLIHGNCFLHRELFLIPAHRVCINTNKYNGIVGYKIDGLSYSTEDLLHLKYCNYSGNKFFSVSAIQVCTPWVNIYKFIQNYISGMVQYGGKPSGILSYNPMMNEKDRTLLKEQFKDLYNNVNNGGGIILTNGNVAWQPIGMEPDKLNLLENLKQATKEIGNCFGIPAILLGESATFANYKEGRKQLWEDVIIPLCTNLIEQISQFFKINMGLNSHNRALLNERLWENDILTLNEKRAILGYNPKGVNM